MIADISIPMHVAAVGITTTVGFVAGMGFYHWYLTRQFRSGRGFWQRLAAFWAWFRRERGWRNAERQQRESVMKGQSSGGGRRNWLQQSRDEGARIPPSLPPTESDPSVEIHEGGWPDAERRQRE